MFLRNRIAAPQGQPQTSNPSPQDGGGGLGALNQTPQPQVSPMQPGMGSNTLNPYGGSADVNSTNTTTQADITGGGMGRGMGGIGGMFGGMGQAMGATTAERAMQGKFGPQVPDTSEQAYNIHMALANYSGGKVPSYEQWKAQQENPFGGIKAQTNPFLGMPMPPSGTPMPILGGMGATTAERAMQGKFGPQVPDTSEQAYNIHMALANYSGGKVPSYEQWKAQQENPFGGIKGETNPNAPTHPFLGTPMPPSRDPFMPLPGGDGQYPRGDFEPKNPFGGSPTNPFPGLPGTPMPRSEIGFMPPSRDPFDTSEQAYRYHIETAKYPPGGVPSYEQWKSGRENRPNPFPGLPGTRMPRSEVPFTGDPGFSIPINFPSEPFDPITKMNKKFGGSPTNPFLGMPMPHTLPGSNFPTGTGRIDPNYDPITGRISEPARPGSVNVPFGTISPKALTEGNTGAIQPTFKPQNRPNPFLGGLGSLLNRKFGSRR